MLISVVAFRSVSRRRSQDGRPGGESNPQPPVLETGALPIELLAYRAYFCSLCGWCFRQNAAVSFFISSRSVVFFLFFVVL